MATRINLGSNGDYLLQGVVTDADGNRYGYEVMVKGLTPEERAATLGSQVPTVRTHGVVIQPMVQRRLGVASR